MSAVASNVLPAPGAGVNPPNGIAFISGKVRSIRRYKTQAGMVHCALIVLPAPDEFTAPSVVEVEASSQIASPGDTVTKLKVQIGGRARGYTSGAGEEVRTADMRLRVVE